MNIKFKRAFLLAFLMLTTHGFSLEKVGTTSFQFLKVLSDARATAMGEAYSAVAMNSDALFWNPARITYVKGFDFTASYMDYFLDIRHMSFSFATSLNELGAIGVFGVLTDAGDIEVTRVENLGFVGDVYNPGLTGETVRPKAFVIGASYARDMTEKFSFGLTVKYGFEDLIEESTGSIMFDAGLNYKTGYKSIEIAAAIRHFGPEVKFVDESYPLPQTFNIGVSAYLIGSNDFLLGNSENQNVLVSFDIMQPRDFDQQYNVGFEYGYHKMYFLRGGYKMNYDSDGLTFGFGINYKDFRIDYSFNDYGEYLDSVQRFTFGVGF